jgi:hypothetical protein
MVYLLEMGGSFHGELLVITRAKKKWERSGNTGEAEEKTWENLLGVPPKSAFRCFQVWERADHRLHHGIFHARWLRETELQGNGGFHSHGGAPNWMAFCHGKSQSKMDDDYGYPYDFGNQMRSLQRPGDTWGILKGPKSWFYNHGYEKSIQVDTIAIIDINRIFVGARIATNRLDSTSTWLKVPPTRNPPILDVT